LLTRDSVPWTESYFFLKIEGQFGKMFSQKSRNSCSANGGGVGAHGHLTRGSNGLSPGTKYKRSKNVFAVTTMVLTVVCPCLELLQLAVQSLIGSPGTLPAASWALTRGKSSKKKQIWFSVPFSKHSNILYWLRYLNFHRPHLRIWMWTMDSRFMRGKFLNWLATRNNSWFDLKFSNFEWGPWRFWEAKSQRFASKSNPD